jgi:expansin (peptidoglycan-binding protein)
MDSITESVQRVVSQLKGNIDYIVSQDSERWVVQVRNQDIPNTLLEFEVLRIDGQYVSCVLQKVNVGRRVMFRFMNKFMNDLIEPKPT